MTYDYYDYVDELTCYKNEDGTPKTTRKLKLLKHAPIPIGEFIKIYYDATVPRVPPQLHQAHDTYTVGAGGVWGGGYLPHHGLL